MGVSKKRKLNYSDKQKTVLLVGWIRDRFKGKPQTSRTSDVLAGLAERELQFRVTAARMCRELRKEGVSFTESEDDPKPQRNYSKIGILRARVDMLEERVLKLERVGRR